MCCVNVLIAWMGVPMIDQVHTLYNASWLVICIMCALAGFVFRDRGMVRSAGVVAFSQAAIDLWFTYGPGFINGQQPWMVYLMVYTISCVAVTVKPTTKLCSLVGGINLGGVLIAVLHGTTAGDDDLFWMNNLMISVCLVLVLLGGIFYDAGKTLLTRIGSRFNRLVGVSRESGLG